MVLNGFHNVWFNQNSSAFLRPESRPASTHYVVIAEGTKEQMKSHSEDALWHPVFPVTSIGFCLS